ncbi:MAG: AroM family protein [Sulfolobales archaeon]|nr:AroM family protein [Sulfolobales archaeon]MDW8083476.1 AroM family protein [Sulfolobales archaeon]
MKRVGLITIGQSPRVDVVPEIRKILESTDVEVVECGALDRLSKEEIASLAPRSGEYILVTRLRDGSEVMVSRERILSLMQKCIDRLEPEVDLLGLLCTGEFPELKSKKLLIEPSDLLLKVVESLKVTNLGIIVPNPTQIDLTIKKWSRAAREIKVVSTSPYSETIDALAKAAEELRECDLIVLDCIGFTSEAKKVVAAVSKRPVIIPRTLLARILRELLET